MAAPVWVLSVDLQTKTATFQSGMAEAAKAARGAFTEIKSGAGDMGRELGGSMTEARHGVMMLGEEFGVHLPRGLTTFIASLGPVGAAMEAAFPFVAITLGATLLLEHLAKMHEEGEKLTEDQMKFGTAAQNAFNALDVKMLQSGIKADELSGNHLAALHKQLELIDKQSMAELAHQFSELAKSADIVFADLKTSWYQFGIGSAGAKHALDEFQNKYNMLLAQGKDSEASDLLKGTRESAQKVLDLQNKAKVTSGNTGAGGDQSALIAHEEAINALKASGVGFTEKEIQAQQTLVDALNAQVTSQSQIAALKASDSANAKRETAGTEASQKSAQAKAAVEAQLRIGEQLIAADRASATSQLDIARASADEREAVDMAFADRELKLQLDSNQKQIAALDKLTKDYPTQLKALHEKAEELTAQHEAKITEITSRADAAFAAKSLQDLEQGEREKIEAQRTGSSARLAAIEAALNREESLGLQSTSFYRDLENQKIQTIRQAAEEEAKLAADAGREAAANQEKMGELALAAQREHIQMMDATMHISAAARLQQELNMAAAETAIKMTAISQEIAALDKGGKDYNNKLKQLQDQKTQLIQAHENQVTQIRDKAEQERNSKILSAAEHFNGTIANGLTQVLMGHKTFASQMDSIGNEVISGMMQRAIQSILANTMTKVADSAMAARKAYIAGVEAGGPAAPVVGATFASEALGAMMAFAAGTDSVPGYGTGDKVPAMLEPGEGVVPGGVMDQLRKMASSGSMGGDTHYHAHASFAPTVHALDADGVDQVLTKHAGKFQKHMENTLRKMNR